jgi:hypothetical protein
LNSAIVVLVSSSLALLVITIALVRDGIARGSFYPRRRALEI